MTENDLPTKLLWIDLEMTGLDPSQQRIIEVAAVVTDFELHELATYQAVIHQPDEVLDKAEDWPKQHMAALFAEVRKSPIPEADAIQAIGDMLTEQFGSEPAVLAGNSIHQDRRFIRQWWPEIDARLHYRMFDVSTLKIWLQGSQNKNYEKNEAHRAMGDIRESIAELRWCLDQISHE